MRPEDQHAQAVLGLVKLALARCLCSRLGCNFGGVKTSRSVFLLETCRNLSGESPVTFRLNLCFGHIAILVTAPTL